MCEAALTAELPESAGAEPILLTAEESLRVDKYLSLHTELTRNRVQHLIEKECVLVNGKPVSNRTLLKAGDEIFVLPEPELTDAVPQDIPLEILYEDGSILVVNKPRGLVVHPAPGHPDGTLVNGLLWHFGELSRVGGNLRPGIVHRIDRMTSGLLAVAKNDAAHIALSAQFKTHSAGRSYIALVDGNIREDSGTVDAPIGRHRTDRKRMAVTENGRPAVTHWQVLKRFRTHTLLRLTLETGRTHQIRVHMAYVKHPVTGDSVYGASNDAFGLGGQALHGYKLVLTHPETGENMRFYAPIPDYFIRLLQRFMTKEEIDALQEQLYET